MPFLKKRWLYPVAFWVFKNQKQTFFIFINLRTRQPSIGTLVQSREK
ncbi:hypothetical protein LEP1GSC125_3668 [Leptospira mayottensis 200901122]|uniref:Uncharacterized protein n=2 Tax=Leptospira mayottensis TaxID=1137606 RepID=A0AA87MNR9_9LEPT|nr:hypothetical protein LEP1GSC125_3668 [Leptospira mayottensis 200901122]